MGIVVSLALLVALMWVVWRFSPRRRMKRNRDLSQVSSGAGSPAGLVNMNADLAIVEQHSRDIGSIGGGGIGGMGI